MAPPVSSALRRVFATLVVVWFCGMTDAMTFPLPIPTRPTTLPVRPTEVGEIIVWGTNTAGSIDVPEGLSNVVAVAAGTYHALALDRNGVVTAWGPGSGFYSETNVPPGLNNVVKIAAATVHSLALKADGTVVAWGSNVYGESSPPGGLSNVIDIAAGNGYSIALRLDGSVVTWGDNRDGSLTPPGDATNIVAIAGGHWPLALKGDGTIVIWPRSSSFPLPVRLTDVAVIGGDNYRSYAIRTDGTVIPSGTIFDIPVGLRAAKIYSGGAAYGPFAAAVKGDGTVTVWGDNAFVVSNAPPRLRDIIELAAGGDFVVALQRPTPPIPTRARATAEIVNGFVVGLNIIDGGEGYAVPPQVTISGGGGFGATATAQISKGVVTGFTVTNAGIGYTSAPTVEIEAPPFLPRLSVATSRVGVTMQVVPGKRYQLESSNDLPNFGPVGTPFVADKDTVTEEFAVSETGQFFRIVEVP